MQMWTHACHSLTDNNGLTTTHIKSGSKETVEVMRGCLKAHNRGLLKITPTNKHKCKLYVTSLFWLLNFEFNWRLTLIYFSWHWCLSAKKQLWLRFYATHKQLGIRITAVGPAGLIEVLDYDQFGRAGVERIKKEWSLFCLLLWHLNGPGATADSSYRGKQVPDVQTGVHISIVGL